VYDGQPFGKKFGDVVHQVRPSYRAGSQVYVSFIAGHPKNDLQTEKSFLSVERKDGDQFIIVATDGSWETKFFWHRTNSLFGESQATIMWDVPRDVVRGTYRIRHFGAHKGLINGVKSYVGVSNEFQVV
jgi:neutral ceramidase